MAETLTSVLDMRDRMTDPLKHVTTALQATTKAMGLVDKQTKHLRVEQLQATKETLKAKDGFKGLDGSLGMVAAGAATTVAAVAAVVAGLVAFGAIIGAITAKVISFVTAQSAMGEKLAASYVLFTDNAAAAARTRDMIDTLASRLNVPREMAHATAKDLLGAGIKNQRELQQTVMAVSALQKLGNESQASQLKGIFSRAGEARRAFGGRGMLAISRVEAEQVLGKGGFADLQARLKAQGGLIRSSYYGLVTTADQGNKALAEAVNKGKLGDAARGMLGGFDELGKRWDLLRAKFFEGIRLSPGFQAFMKALHGALDVFEVFTKQAGNSTALGILNVGFKVLAKVIDKGVILTLHMITYTYKFATAALKVYLTLKQWLKTAENMKALKGALLGVGLFLGIILVAVVALAAAFVILWAVIMLPLVVIVGAFALLGMAIQKVIDNFATWKQDAINAVGSLIDGLVTGMRNGVTGVIAAAKALGAGTIAALKTVLGIHSPSKEMAKLGAMSAAGFQGGLDSHGDFKLGGVKAPALGGGSKGSIGPISIAVYVKGGTSMGEEELKPLMTDAFSDALERLQLEYGVG